MTVGEFSGKIRKREVSCRELTEESLRRIEAGSRLNAFITVTAEHARKTADKLDAELANGIDRGPLHGIPVALKDLFAMRGYPNTCGSPLFAQEVCDYDSAVTERLEAAGAVIVGKTNLHELAYGVTSNNPHYGPVRNPHDPDCIPGGSSGGSGAAVAAGMVAMAMGTDTGGSIRIPAGYCGAVGIKPTYGLVSRFGCAPLGLSLDHMGPLTSTVRDAAICLEVLAGHDPRDPNTRRDAPSDMTANLQAGAHGVRIGAPENFFVEGLDPWMESAYRNALDRATAAGASVVPVKVPDMAALNVISRVILLAEAASVLHKHTHDRSKFGADVMSLMDQGRLLPATGYIHAQRLRREFQTRFHELFTRIDCLLTPTIPIGAPRIGQDMVVIAGREENTRLASTRFVRGINALGLPAISIPCGRTAAGLPLGLQIIGRAWEDSLVLRVAAALEQ